MAAVCADAHGRHSDAEQGARGAKPAVAEIKGEEVYLRTDRRDGQEWGYGVYCQRQH